MFSTKNSYHIYRESRTTNLASLIGSVRLIASQLDTVHDLEHKGSDVPNRYVYGFRCENTVILSAIQLIKQHASHVCSTKTTSAGLNYYNLDGNSG